MKKAMLNLYIRIKCRVDRALKEERGEANIVAIILVIIAVIALAAIFKDTMIEIVNGLFERIKTQLGL